MELPHYVRQSIELKEALKDDTDYFLEKYVDPDQEKKKQIELIKERQDKARRYSSQVRNKALAVRKSMERKSSKSLLPSNNKISSSLARVSNNENSASKLDISFKDVDTDNHEISPSNTNGPNLEQRIKILEAELQETQSKYLRFMLRGNPTNKRQINDELKWLFAQMRGSVLSKMKEKEGKIHSKLVQEISHLKQSLNARDKTLKQYEAQIDDLMEEQQKGLSSVETRNVTLKIEELAKVLSKCHNLKYENRRKKTSDLHSSLNRLKVIIDKVHKKSGKPAAGVVRSPLSKITEKQKLKLSPKSLGIKQKRKQTVSQKRENEEDKLLNLNERMMRLDQKLRKSNSLLDDMLLRHK